MHLPDPDQELLDRGDDFLRVAAMDSAHAVVQPCGRPGDLQSALYNLNVYNPPGSRRDAEILEVYHEQGHSRFCPGVQGH